MANKKISPNVYSPTTPERSNGERGNLPPSRGFAMLFSVLISSLLVVIGLSIFNITLKELTISTSARESQIAFYAANSGMECALYWYLKQNAFATSTSDVSRATGITPAECGDNASVNSNIDSQLNSATTEFEFHVLGSSGSCANVFVKNEKNGTKIDTTIESQGKNICGASGRRVERGLRASISRDM